MYTIDFTKKAVSQLEKISKADSTHVLKKLYSIRDNPLPHLKKLTGTKLWRLRSSKFRVILDVVVSGKTLVVLRIGKRDKVYD
jgi:mRNA-degrading endonuclease RelE of RelBE toxin-antitoxin system